MTTPAPRQPASRRTREAAVAVVLLPILLLLGILLGTKVLGGDGDATETVASTTRSPGGLLVGPKLATGVPSSAAASASATAKTSTPTPSSATPTPTAAPTTTAPSATAAPTPPPVATTSPSTAAPTTKAPTTKAPTTKAPTTKAPTTKAPTTKAPGASPSASSTPSAGSSSSADDDSDASASSPPRTLRRVLGPGVAGSDVRAWQAKMAQRGWIIRVDGVYGSQTASVAQRFQVEKRLPVDGLVGLRTYRAAWSLPVT